MAALWALLCVHTTAAVATSAPQQVSRVKVGALTVAPPSASPPPPPPPVYCKPNASRTGCEASLDHSCSVFGTSFVCHTFTSPTSPIHCGCAAKPLPPGNCDPLKSCTGTCEDIAYVCRQPGSHSHPGVCGCYPGPQAVRAPPIVTIDVAAEYGSISFGTIRRAMAAATAAIVGGSSATVFFTAGMHNITLVGSLFNVSVIAPEGGRLTIAGAGMDATTLVLTTGTASNDVIFSHGGAQRITFRDLTFARSARTTTLGHLTHVGATTVTIELLIGAPDLASLFADREGRLSAEQGLYLRRFERDRQDDDEQSAWKLVVPTTCSHMGACAPWPPTLNAQVHFKCGGEVDGIDAGGVCPDVTNLGGGKWKLLVQSSEWSSEERARYTADIGNKERVVGVKVKHGGQAFNIRGGDGTAADCKDIAFISVRWVGHSRGIIEGCDNVVFRHTRVDREASISGLPLALATPGGGPQINTASNLTILNHSSVGTGDDSLGLFNIASGSVRGCHIRDSFARGILLNNVSKAFVVGEDNDVLRCPIYRTNHAA